MEAGTVKGVQNPSVRGLAEVATTGEAGKRRARRIRRRMGKGVLRRGPRVKEGQEVDSSVDKWLSLANDMIAQSKPVRPSPPQSELLINRSEVKSFSRVQLCDPMDYSPPGSLVRGIFQARILE